MGLGGRAAVPGVPRLSRPGNRSDDPGGIDPADPVVVRVRHVDVTGRVHCYARGEIEVGLGGRAAVPGVPRLSRPGNRSDDPGGIDPADPVVVRVRHVDVTDRVHC